MTKRKPSATQRAKGVELRANSYRFKDRTRGQLHYVNYPFLPEADCRKAKLPPNDPRWPANALADANEYSRTYHRDAHLPRIQERPAIAGTLREWLERYPRVIALAAEDVALEPSVMLFAASTVAREPLPPTNAPLANALLLFPIAVAPASGLVREPLPDAMLLAPITWEYLHRSQPMLNKESWREVRIQSAR